MRPASFLSDTLAVNRKPLLEGDHQTRFSCLAGMYFQVAGWRMQILTQRLFCILTTSASMPWDTSPHLAYPLLNCAIRELEEETGIAITGVAETLSEFHYATSTYLPNNHAIRLICRAVTPPGYIRRFDTRFFLVDAGMVNISGTTLDTNHASDELEDLHWAPLSSVRAYNIAFITRRIISLAVNNLAGCQVAQYHHVDDGLPMVADLHNPGSHQCHQ